MTELEQELITMVKELTETAYLLMNDLAMQREASQTCLKAEDLVSKATGKEWEAELPDMKGTPMPTDRPVLRYCHDCQGWREWLNVTFAGQDVCRICNAPLAPVWMEIK